MRDTKEGPNNITAIAVILLSSASNATADVIIDSIHQENIPTASLEFILAALYTISGSFPGLMVEAVSYLIGDVS
jgi:hypothetical protein